MNIANTSLQIGSSNVQIASVLTGKIVRYLNKGTSTVRKDGIRTFKIEGVENVFFADKTGYRCVTVLAKDIDDAGESKYRTLHLSGIASVI